MRSRHFVLLLLTISDLIVSRAAFADDRPRRVLILDSFSPGAASLNEHIFASRTGLRDVWPRPRDRTVDWRELERWQVALNRLPTTSAVLFRPPSFWQIYWSYILGVVTLISLQTLLITGLLLQRRRRNRAERQLAQSERRMHLIADSLPALIAYVDRDQRYVFMNRAYESWFGIDPESARGRLVRDVLGNELYALALPYVARVLSGEQVTFTPEVTLVRGQRRAVEALYVPDLDERGVVRGYFALVVDVTDRKHAELEARQIRDELAHAGRIATMGEMAAALAHELNQPLAAILSNAQAAKRFLSAPTRTWTRFAKSSTTSSRMTPGPARSSVGSGRW